MTSRCLSELGPPPGCGNKTVCQICITSCEKYERDTRNAAIDAAIRLLTAHGYTITAPGLAQRGASLRRAPLKRVGP